MAVSYRRCLAGLVWASGLCAACTVAAAEPLVKQQHSLDRFGDSLPEDALFRLGSLRFRFGREVVYLAFSKDGKTLLSVNRKGWPSWGLVLCHWDAPSGRLLREEKLPWGLHHAAHENNRIALSPDGKLMAFLPQPALWAGRIQVVNTDTGKIVRSFAEPDLEPGVGFAPDGQMLATADREGTIFLWHPFSGKALGQCKGNQSRCLALAFSPDGKRIASIDTKSIIRLWNPITGQELRQLQVQKDPCGDARLAFSPDGKILAVCCHSTLVFWDIKMGRTLRSAGFWYKTLAFSPDGKLLAGIQGVGTRLGEKGLRGVGVVCLVDASTAKVVRKLGWRTDYHSTGVRLAFSPDGKLLAGGDDNIHLWRVAQGEEVQPGGGSAPEIDSAVFSPDSRFLITGGPDQFIRMWDAATGAEARRFKAYAPKAGILALSQDGKILRIRQEKTTLRGEMEGSHFFLWDWAAGKEVRRIEARSGVWSGEPEELSPSCRIDAWPTWDSNGYTIHLWDTITNKELFAWKSKLDPIASLYFSPQEKYLIAFNAWTSSHPQFEIREVATGKDPSFADKEGVIAAVSEDERIAARIDRDMYLHFQELPSGKEIARTKQRIASGFKMGRSLPLVHAVFSPDGRMLATAIDYEPIRLWETATGTERHRFAPQRGRIIQLAFAPDGSKLVSVSTEKNAVVWRVYGPSPGRQPAELAAEQLRGLWADLAREDGHIAFRAVRALIAAVPGPVVDHLRRQGKDIPRFERRRVVRCIAELESDEFAVRDNASTELERLGILAEESLRKALQDRPTLEMRKRLETLLDTLKARPISPAIARGWRAVEVLEHLATPEARQLLYEWSKDIPQAKAALERLARRSVRKP